jgi:hypothetical protein
LFLQQLGVAHKVQLETLSGDLRYHMEGGLSRNPGFGSMPWKWNDFLSHVLHTLPQGARTARKKTAIVSSRTDDFTDLPGEPHPCDEPTPGAGPPPHHQTKFVCLRQPVPFGHRVNGWRVRWPGCSNRDHLLHVVMLERPG